MSKTLEKFAKEINFPLEFRQQIEKIRISVKNQETVKINKKSWMCTLQSPFIGQRISVKSKRGQNTLPYFDGKTRKEAKDKLIAAIRGAVIKYGHGLALSIRVPKNLK